MTVHKITRNDLTPAQNFGILKAILVKKGIITNQEFEMVQDELVELQNEALAVDPAYQFMMNKFGSLGKKKE